MNMRAMIMTCIAAAGSIAVCNAQATEPNAKSNTQKAVELLKSIETGDKEPAGNINAGKYIQHNLDVANGIDGFGALLGQLADYPEKPKVNSVRAFQDGDYVVVQSDYNFFGPKIGFDIFRFEDGKIVEHWDNLMPAPTSANPSGHTAIDGATTVTDLCKTDSNKALAQKFVEDVLIQQKRDNLGYYFDGDKLIQHDPQTGDGVKAYLAGLSQNGHDYRYGSIEKVLGQGNFVLVVSQGTDNGTPVAYYDLYRLENGKIAEHWDVIEKIPPQSEWKNPNGKFGFI